MPSRYAPPLGPLLRARRVLGAPDVVPAPRAGDERLRLALDAAKLSVWAWDIQGDRIHLDAGDAPDGGVATPDEESTPFSGFLARVHPQDRARIWAAVERASDDGADLEMEYRVLGDGERIAWCYSRGHVTVDGFGEPSHVLGVTMDITDRKQLEEKIAHQAFHDPLTGLANRVLFRDRVAHAIARTQRRGSPPAVLFLDLDNFKAVNDSFGHAAGDHLLTEVAGRLGRTLRAAATCARPGGDEFAVLLEDAPDGAAPGANAACVAERLLAAFAPPIVVEGTEVFVGVSVGIAVAAAGDTAEELLRNADLAMYRAKTTGKARYEVFEPTMHAAVRRRLELEAELRRAVEEPDGQLVLHYRPIALLATGTVIGFEALVRWRHPSRGLVPPGEFIGIAEETGLVVPLGRWVLREACRQAAAWLRERGPDAALSISVNLSGRQLALPELPDHVEQALAESGLPPQSLVLEMTESTLVDHSRATLDRLWMLRGLGVRLAIDDFGTGYSSLGYLERFPVNLLKIDKAFVDRVGAVGNESPLARAILGLGGALGMRVVAEGIETAAQWQRLRELGCELGQGYYIAKPLPADDAVRMLAATVA